MTSRLQAASSMQASGCPSRFEITNRHQRSKPFRYHPKQGVSDEALDTCSLSDHLSEGSYATLVLRIASPDPQGKISE